VTHTQDDDRKFNSLALPLFRISDMIKHNKIYRNILNPSQLCIYLWCHFSYIVSLSRVSVCLWLCSLVLVQVVVYLESAFRKSLSIALVSNVCLLGSPFVILPSQPTWPTIVNISMLLRWRFNFTNSISVRLTRKSSTLFVYENFPPEITTEIHEYSLAWPTCLFRRHII